MARKKFSWLNASNCASKLRRYWEKQINSYLIQKTCWTASKKTMKNGNAVADLCIAKPIGQVLSEDVVVDD